MHDGELRLWESIALALCSRHKGLLGLGLELVLRSPVFEPRDTRTPRLVRPC